MALRWHLLSTALASLCLISIVHSADPEFPKLENLEIDSVTTEVQVTDAVTQDTAYVTEMYDFTEKTGRLHMVIERKILDVFYYNETQQVIEVNSTMCLVWGIDETTYTTENVFYGWHHPDPLVIGPSALLFYAQDRRKDIKFSQLETVRDIPNCEKYTLLVQNSQENIAINYYFAPKDWTTPYQLDNLRVPVRIHVVGNSSKNVEGNRLVPVEIVNDYAYFKPAIDDEADLQPPVGLGCKLKTQTDRFPKIPDSFKYSAEVVDLVEASEHEKVDVKFERVWYDSKNRLGTFVIYKKTSTLRSFQDYNTGVMFNYENGQRCEIKPVMNAFFEKYDSRFAGEFKDPKEVLYLDGKFYEMGQRQVRGLTCDIFESVEHDHEYESEEYPRFVVTAYFVEDYTKVGVDSDLEKRIPIQVTLTGWKDYKTMAFQKQYSVFGFRDLVPSEITKGFELDKCYKKANSKSYFVIVLSVPAEVAAKLEEQDKLVRAELKTQVAVLANIADWRIPFFAVDYTSKGVYARGLMLDRPPALMQFWNTGKGEDFKARENHIKLVDSGTVEDCADACVDAEGCTGIYYCNSACFLKDDDPSNSKDEGSTMIDLGVCDEYLRVERGTSNKHNTPLKNASEKLARAVADGNVTVWIELPNGQEQIKVTEITFGEGPYNDDNAGDTPFAVNVRFRSLDPTLETSKAFADVDLVNSCYRKCQEMGSGCSSFSFCSKATDSKKKDRPRCVVSSELVVRGKTNDIDLIQDESCDIYNLKYLEYFTKYPEQVSFLPGYKELTAVDSAEECAMFCRFDGKTDKNDVQICRGFEYCGSRKSCFLHKKHILDLKPGETGTVAGKPPCVHYAARFIADYANMGKTLVEDTSNVRYQLSLEDCARVCSEELGDSCKSFNYCPDKTSCELSGKVLVSVQKPIEKESCLHYEKRNNILDWTKSSDEKLTQSGFTSKGFTGLVIGMLFLGIVLGALAFVGYSYFRSRQYGEGMTVRFMRSDA